MYSNFKQVKLWVLDYELAAGGMGKVYKAHHETLGYPVVVKFILPELMDSSDAVTKSKLLERFAREGDILSKLDHERIVKVLDFSPYEPYFLVMPYIDGQTLRNVYKTVLAASANKPDLVLDYLISFVVWVCQVLDGLDYLHTQNIIHRDIKPENIIINGKGNAIITDFGIALNPNYDRLSTVAGGYHPLGTYSYMSPEQILTPDKLSNKSDIFSVGILLYELVTQKEPFSSLDKKINLELEAVPPTQINPILNEQINKVVLKALAKKVEYRYSSCAEFAQELRNCITPLDNKIKTAKNLLAIDFISERDKNLYEQFLNDIKMLIGYIPSSGDTTPALSGLAMQTVMKGGAFSNFAKNGILRECLKYLETITVKEKYLILKKVAEKGSLSDLNTSSTNLIRVVHEIYFG